MKSEFYILYKHGLEEEIKWPNGWGYTCRGNIAPMLQEVLKTRAVASEIKALWNDQHGWTIIRDYNITHDQLTGYLKAKTGSLHFRAAGTRDRAIKALKKMGAAGLLAVDNYKQVLTCQAHFYEHGCFPELRNP